MRTKIILYILAIVPVLSAMQNCSSAKSGESSSNSTAGSYPPPTGVSSNGSSLNFLGSCKTAQDTCGEAFNTTNYQAVFAKVCTDDGGTWSNTATCGTSYKYRCDVTEIKNGIRQGQVDYYKEKDAQLASIYGSLCKTQY